MMLPRVDLKLLFEALTLNHLTSSEYNNNC